MCNSNFLMWIRIACGYLAIVFHCNYYLITFFINESIHSCKPFLHCFILQLLSKLCDLFCELFVCLQVYVPNLYGIRASMDKTLVLLRSPVGSFFWAKLLLPVLHQKQRIHHLIYQQACLINYDGCEGNSKSADCRPYFLCLIVWRVIISSHSIHYK